MSKKRTTTRAWMLSLAKKWTKSNRSQKLFCVEHGLSVSTLGYWLRQYRGGEESPPGFVALPMTLPREATFEIHYPNGVFVKAPSDIDASLLRTLLTSV